MVRGTPRRGHRIEQPEQPERTAIGFEYSLIERDLREVTGFTFANPLVGAERVVEQVEVAPFDQADCVNGAGGTLAVYAPRLKPKTYIWSLPWATGLALGKNLNNTAQSSDLP